MCDSLHPFRVHANHLTTTKTDRYGLMVPYTFFSFTRQVQCLPGIFGFVQHEHALKGASP